MLKKERVRVRRVFVHIFPSVDAWNIGEVDRKNEKATESGLSFQ